jgi:hypothetical protein
MTSYPRCAWEPASSATERDNQGDVALPPGDVEKSSFFSKRLGIPGGNCSGTSDADASGGSLPRWPR